MNLPVLVYETSEPPLLYSRVRHGCGDEIRTHIISFTRRALSCLLELHRKKDFGGLGGTQTLTRSLQDFYAINYITSPFVCLDWWLWAGLNRRPPAYEADALDHLSYTAIPFAKARGGVEPLAFRPTLCGAV